MLICGVEIKGKRQRLPQTQFQMVSGCISSRQAPRIPSDSPQSLLLSQEVGVCVWRCVNPSGAGRRSVSWAAEALLSAPPKLPAIVRLVTVCWAEKALRVKCPFKKQYVAAEVGRTFHGVTDAVWIKDCQALIRHATKRRKTQRSVVCGAR